MSAACSTHVVFRLLAGSSISRLPTDTFNYRNHKESITMTNRRDFIKGAGALALGSAFPFESAIGAGNLTVGVIYVGARGDYGYNQAQAQAANVIKKLPNVKVVEEENVPETVAVQKTMEAMIEQDGATLIFATSFGYFDPHVLKMAAKYPNVRFAHCGGLGKQGNPPKIE